MNETIIQILNYYLPTWITKKGGLLKVLTKNQFGEIGRFPVCVNREKTTCEGGDYISLIPDSREKAISFFQIQSNSVSENFGFYDIKTTFRLVVWVNTDKINQTMIDTDLLMLDVIKNMPFRIANSDILCKIKTQFLSAGKENVWSQFTMKEENKQFLLLPYDFFTIDYDVFYSFRKECIEDINLNPTVC
jgi:hypothetical protein